VSIDLLNPTPAHRAIRQAIRQFAEREVAPRAEERDRSESFDRELFARAGELGVLGILVPERFGGAGMDATGAVIVHEELAAADPGFALSVLSHAILFANHLARSGSEEQCRRFLPEACAGRLIGGVAMTEAEAGTDVMAMKTTARLDGDRYRINGRKMWITNGSTGDGESGDVFLVYARTGHKGPAGLSLFLIERGAPGFSLGQTLRGKLGVRSSTTAELVFDDCVVSTDDRVGEQGAAVKDMMRLFEIERLTMAAIGLGIARRALEIMNRHASARRSFDRPLRAFGQIRRHLAESYAEFAAARYYVYATACDLDLDRSDRALDADGTKLFCATVAKNVADRAIQVLGASGYVAESVVERLWRDAKLLEIGGGTLEAHQNNIAQNLRRVDRIL
jgi:isovaleryl-CoA dehydrogenase